MKVILLLVVWLLFIVLWVVGFIKDLKAIKALEGRKEVLKEVEDLLFHELYAGGKMTFDEYFEFTRKFWDKFGKYME